MRRSLKYKRLQELIKNPYVLLSTSLALFLVINLFYQKPSISGHVTKDDFEVHKLLLNQTFLNSSAYMIGTGNKSTLVSLKVSGYLTGTGTAKIYVINDGKNYTVLDSGLLKEKGMPAISSLAVKSDETEDNPDNNRANSSNASINRSIAIQLEYKNDSIYDENDDGIENINGVIDFTIQNSEFNWKSDESKLCTRWEVYDLDADKSTSQCYGSDDCCSLVGLKPSRENWSEPFYSVYGKDGAGLNNIVGSQIIYADYSLSTDNPHSEIVYSQSSDLSAKYISDTTVFTEVCKDTCVLENFNGSSYTLIIELENATLHLNEIAYSLLPNLDKHQLKLNLIGSGIMNSLISVYEGNNLVTSGSSSVLELEPGNYDPHIVSENKLFEIVLHDINLTEDLEKNIIFDEIKNNISLDGIEINKKYYIELDSENATIESEAFGNVLYECRDFNYNSGLCLGEWEKLQDLTVNEAYKISLTKGNFGFIEGSPKEFSPANVTSLVFSNNISNITIIKNNNATIDLSRHFSNIDNGTIFDYYRQDGINILFENNISTIVPEKDFVGAIFTFITANKSSTWAVSNLFSVNVENEIVVAIVKYNLTDPLIQLKLKKYTDLQLKPILNYNQIIFTGYEIKNDVVIMYIKIDDKSIRWMTSLSAFTEVLKNPEVQK